jgi:hypothetical protein
MIDIKIALECVSCEQLNNLADRADHFVVNHCDVSEGGYFSNINSLVYAGGCRAPKTIIVFRDDRRNIIDGNITRGIRPLKWCAVMLTPTK